MAPLVHIGWILATDQRETEEEGLYAAACGRLEELLQEQFPGFRWQVELLNRHQYAPRGGALSPLQLLSFGLQEKIVHHWDYALVVVPNALRPRERAHTIGVPSSALEVAVLSTADLDERAPDFCDKLITLALHLLGHLWGLEHQPAGPMAPPEATEALRLAPFPDEQERIIVDRLEEVADKRLEEQAANWNALTFYWRAFWADPKSILIDIIGYSPWRLPLQTRRLTAATAVSLVLLLLSAEAWEVGVNLAPLPLLVGALVAIMIATAFIFTGQNLGQLSRDVGWREQLTRTRIVIFGTVLLGLTALWLILVAITIVAGWLLPDAVLAGWTGLVTVEAGASLRHAMFMAILGVLAGALGGNLEDEDEIKAELLYDEEM